MMYQTRKNLLGVLLLCLSCSGTQAGIAPEPEIRIQEEADTLVIDISYRLPVNSRVAWDVLTDFNNMTEFVPNLSSSRILQRDGRQLVVEQKGKISFGVLSFPYESKREIELTPYQKVRSHAVSGTQMDSVTTLTPSGAGTLLTYHAEAVPDLPISSSMIASTLRETLETQFKAMEQEMEARSKNMPTPTPAAPSLATPSFAASTPASTTVARAKPTALSPTSATKKIAVVSKRPAKPHGVMSTTKKRPD